MRIEVIHALPERSRRMSFELSDGATVADALAAAAIQSVFAGLDLSGAAVGIFGRPVLRDHLLTEGDRVEIYRPLLIDAKDERRARANDARHSARNAVRNAVRKPAL